MTMGQSQNHQCILGWTPYHTKNQFYIEKSYHKSAYFETDGLFFYTSYLRKLTAYVNPISFLKKLSIMNISNKTRGKNEDTN